MECIEETVCLYLEQHRKNLLPDQIQQKPVLTSICDGTISTWNDMQYLTFLDECFFQPTEQIQVTVDQLTERDKSGTYRFRQMMLHNHEWFELFYVYSGRCISIIQGEPHEFHAGDLCLLSPLAIHNMQFPEENDVVINILIRKSLFDHTFLELVKNSELVTGFFLDALYNIHSRQRYIVFHKEDTTIAKPVVLQMLYESIRKNYFYQDVLRAYLICLLADLTRCYSVCPANTADESGLNPKEVIAYISEHCQTVTIEEVARTYGYSVRSVSTFIHDKTGRTFRKLLKNVRLQQAGELLLKSSLSIDEVAFHVGYTHRCNFERAFKEVYQVTPREYRKRYGNPNVLQEYH